MTYDMDAHTMHISVSSQGIEESILWAAPFATTAPNAPPACATAATTRNEDGSEETFQNLDVRIYYQ
jgi:hypothetical protein